MYNFHNIGYNVSKWDSVGEVLICVFLSSLFYSERKRHKYCDDIAVVVVVVVIVYVQNLSILIIKGRLENWVPLAVSWVKYLHLYSERIMDCLRVIEANYRFLLFSLEWKAGKYCRLLNAYVYVSLGEWKRVIVVHFVLARRSWGGGYLSMIW